MYNTSQHIGKKDMMRQEVWKEAWSAMDNYQYEPTRFMLPTSHYDKEKADRAVAFIQSLSHTKGAFYRKPFVLMPW